jgi:hypothetical protein
MQLPNPEFDSRFTESFVAELVNIYRTEMRTSKSQKAKQEMRFMIKQSLKGTGFNMPISDRYLDTVSEATIQELACSNYDMASKLLAQYKVMTAPKFQMVRLSN